MTRALVIAVLLSCVMHDALAGGQPIKDAPSTIRIASGKEVKVLSITRTTLHGSDEPAVAVQYVTDISISDTEKLYSEAEQVFNAIRALAEREKVRAAIVAANESASGLISMSRAAGWCWKQRANGTWGAPDESDHARVPK